MASLEDKGVGRRAHATIAEPKSLSEDERLERAAARSSRVIAFAGGLPSVALFPRGAISKAFLRALSADQGAALQYSWPEGMPELREYIAATLTKRGAKVSADRVIVTSGAQQALAIAMSVVRRKGLTIAFDPESYPGALSAARDLGAHLVRMTDRAHLYYAMPEVAAPRGNCMPAGTREELLTRARSAKAFIIEDDAYADTAFHGALHPPLLADAPDRVFHVGTFSKTLCPGLRVGWLVTPEHLTKQALQAKQNQDLQSNGLTQSLLHAYLDLGRFEELKARARRHYRRQAGLLMTAVSRHLPGFEFEPPQGGFSLWLERKTAGGKEGVLFELAVRHGVSFDRGSTFRPHRGRRLAFRLCYSSVAAEDIEPGVRRLAKAVERFDHQSAARQAMTAHTAD